MGYTMNGRIRYSEVDENGQLSVYSLINYFQDCSTFQSEHLGYGIRYLKACSQAWILSSWQIMLNRMPALGEEVEVSTWPYEFRDFFGLRNFLMTDSDRNVLAYANSVWVLLDTVKQKPVRVGAEMGQAFKTEEKLDMPYASRKIRLPRMQACQEEPFLIGKHHLDTNHHVNNGQYILMGLEYLPSHFQVGQLRAEYRAQAHLHDLICPAVYIQENMVTVALNGDGGKTYAVIEATRKTEG